MQVINRFKARIAAGMPYLAWASFILAVTGGVLLPGTPLGDWLTEELLESIFPGWIMGIALAGGFVGFVLDLRHDLIPDRAAVSFAALAPTLATSVDGRLAGRVTDFSEWVAGWSVEWLKAETGLVEPWMISLLSLYLAWEVARRVVKPRKTSGHGGGGH